MASTCTLTRPLLPQQREIQELVTALSGVLRCVLGAGGCFLQLVVLKSVGNQDVALSLHWLLKLYHFQSNHANWT